MRPRGSGKLLKRGVERKIGEWLLNASVYDRKPPLARRRKQRSTNRPGGDAKRCGLRVSFCTTVSVPNSAENSQPINWKTTFSGTSLIGTPQRKWNGAESNSCKS